MRRRQIITSAVLSAIAVAAMAVPAPAAKPLDPVYIPAGQYRAELNQTTRNWTLMPVDGQDLVVSNPDVFCRADPAVPKGLWFVGRGANGDIELVASSQTTLPLGYPERIALRNCDEKSPGTAIHAPRALVDWLAVNAGAVYVND
jgi:hypothetical protein